eukprot:TRINITY_DN7427_c0_g1_i2.p1 TRINITY_DN7427_c0_g1~~TRINITY_DN7427_c0_g1_i2.p1  ORF type:complete len:583 (+),score=284.26 TRINITY_DN7427_c0_g1_i2:880-2628(+)
MQDDDANLRELSKDELLVMIRAEDAKLKELQDRLKEAHLSARMQKMREAELKKFSEREREVIRKVFDMFDANGNGNIEVCELQNVAKELKYSMSDEEAQEAMAELDTNNDHQLGFEEFLLWWGSSSERGGNKGIKLDLMKAKLKARFIAEDLKEHIKKSHQRRADKTHYSQSLTANVTIGTDGGGGAEAPSDSGRPLTSIHCVAIPSDPVMFSDEVHKYLPDHPITALDEDSEEVAMRYMLEILFDMRNDLDMKDVHSAVECANNAFSDHTSAAFHAEAQITAENKIRLVGYTRMATDPIEEITSLFLHVDNPDECGWEIFTVASLLVQSRQDGEEFLRWDSEIPVLDMLDQLTVQGHVKMSSHVNDLFESYVFHDLVAKELLDELNEKRDAVLMTALSRLFESAEFDIHANSSKEAVRSVVDALATFPLQVAARRGVCSKELEDEVELLRVQFKKQLDDLFKTEITVSILMAKLLKQLLNLEEYTTAMVSFGTCCKGIASVKLQHPLFNVKATISGLPICLYLFQDNVEAMMKEVLERRAMNKVFDSDEEDEKYPATKKVLDETDTVFGESFRAVLRGKKA